MKCLRWDPAGGATDEDMFVVIKEVIVMDRGMVVVASPEVLSRLPLPIAGLLLAAPADAVARTYEELENNIESLGNSLKSPMTEISFLALSVIPELKLTDKGLVDITRSELLEFPSTY